MNNMACVGADGHPRWVLDTNDQLSTCRLLHCSQALLVGGGHRLPCAELWTMGVKTLHRAHGARTAG